MPEKKKRKSHFQTTVISSGPFWGTLQSMPLAYHNIQKKEHRPCQWSLTHKSWHLARTTTLFQMKFFTTLNSEHHHGSTVSLRYKMEKKNQLLNLYDPMVHYYIYWVKNSKQIQSSTPVMQPCSLLCSQHLRKVLYRMWFSNEFSGELFFFSNVYLKEVVSWHQGTQHNWS